MTKRILFLAVLLATLSCNDKIKSNNEEIEDGLSQITFRASSTAISETQSHASAVERASATVTSDSDTKTALGSNGISVEWVACDEISIYDGTANRLFTAQSSGASTDITGSANSGVATYYALYPYNSAATFLSDRVKTTLPAAQTATRGSFASGSNITIAQSDDKNNLTFANTLSLAKITIDNSKLGGHALKSIALESAYDIAGELYIKYSDAVAKSTGTNTVKEITLTAATSFADGDYYLTLLPNAGGSIVLTFTDTDGKVTYKKAPLSRPFTAGTIKNLGTVSGLVWESTGSGTGDYEKVTSNLSDWSGDYVLVYESRNKIFAGKASGGDYGADEDVTITGDKVSYTDGHPHNIRIESVSGGYTMMYDSQYLYYTGSKNYLFFGNSATSTNYNWSISYVSGACKIENVGYSGEFLQYNTSAPRFSCYKATQHNANLYRLTASGSSPIVKPTPDPDPNVNPNPNPEPEPEPEPEPQPEPGPTQGNQAGWAELPVMNFTKSGNYLINSTDNNIYYAYHFCAGGETGPTGNTARNYTVCFSGEHHCPLWVAAPRHSMYVGSSGRHDSYKVDPDIPSNIQYHGKDADSGCNNGHMLGSAERTSSVATNQQVFYFSNIAPQLQSGFNTGGGGWNLLEDWVDSKVCADTLYEVVGCYFENYTDGYNWNVSPEKISFGGRSDVSKPTMFYYLLLRTKRGNTGKSVKECTASELQCAAFVRSHTNSLKGQHVSSREMMSVSALEAITGFTYFPNVPNAPKDTFNASDWGL